MDKKTRGRGAVRRIASRRFGDRRRLIVEALEDRRLMTIDLASLTSLQGSIFYGADASDLSGAAVSSAGDFNADGYDDFLIGAVEAEAAPGGANSGVAYLVFGGASPSSSLDLSNLGSAGVKLVGSSPSSRTGMSLGRAGDVNNDGFADILVSAPFAARPSSQPGSGIEAGVSYIVFGGQAVPSTIDLGSLGANGVAIWGSSAGDRSGTSVAGVGDFNADGFDDVLIGAPRADGIGDLIPDSGEAYLVFGRASFPSLIDTSSLGSFGTVFYGVDASDAAGTAVAGGIDFNRDGLKDILIGAPGADGLANNVSNAGEAYIVYGRMLSTTSLTLSNLTGRGATFYGIDADDATGTSLAGVGDYNNDEFDDVAIGSVGGDGTIASPAVNSGETYLVLGAASTTLNLSLSSLGTRGVVFYGAGNDDASGGSVSSAGDVNADGYDDLLIGASAADGAGNLRNASGEAYVLFGRLTPPATQSLASLTGVGFVVLGAEIGDQAGTSVAAAGDVNGDGFSDFFVGAPQADGASNGRLNSGESYLLFGGNNFTSSVSHLGTPSNDTLTSSNGADVVNGGRGNDTLTTSGARVVIGGQGDDVITIRSTTFRRVAGGTGTDTLTFGGSMNCDLTNLADSRLTGIERIDITGAGNNTLTLSHREVLNISGQTNTLFVDGNSGDRIRLDRGWNRLINVTIGGFNYVPYTQGIATLYVRSSVAVTFVSIDVANIVTVGGVALLGTDAGDEAGSSVATVGDLNGDGYEDLIVGAKKADGTNNGSVNAGEAYVVFGKPTWTTTTTLDLQNLGIDGVRLVGIDLDDETGASVAGAGDINGDGFKDLVIGAPKADSFGNLRPDAGETYIVFGKADWSTTPLLELSNLGTAGVTIYGAEAGDLSGTSVGKGGDVNGDGYNDIVIGAPAADGPANGRSEAGETYVVFGKADWVTTPTVDLASLGSAGLIIYGADAGDLSGSSVSIAGDANGDGASDLLIGAPASDAANNGKVDAGETYLLFLKKLADGVGVLDLASPSGIGMVFYGADADDRAGGAVTFVGDVNADGFDDFAVGAENGDSASNARPDAGDSYVVFGDSNWNALTSFDLALGGNRTVRVRGASNDDRSGLSIAHAGDVNADGYDDFIVGAPRADGFGDLRNESGEAFVVWGRTSSAWGALNNVLDLASFSTADGIQIFGADPSDGLGIAAGTAGDINGDGFSDMIFSSNLSDSPNGTLPDTGEVYILFGGNQFTSSVTLLGTNGDDTRNAGITRDVFVGGRGNDRIIETVSTSVGIDSYIGGQGNDIFEVFFVGSPTQFTTSHTVGASVDGGTGFDTLLHWAGSGSTLNLVAMPDNRIVDIEQIDLVGGTASYLGLNAAEVLDLSSTTNTLIVRGEAIDRVGMETGWTRTSDQSIGSDLFKTYVKGAATLLVQWPVAVEINAVDVGDFAASGGTTLAGTDAHDRSHTSVDGVGDVNGDGLDDFLIGIPNADGPINTSSDVGEAWLVFGRPQWLSVTLNLDDLGSGGVRLIGVSTGDGTGTAVSGIGDINADGFADFAIGAPFADGTSDSNPSSGETYVVFGRADWSTTPEINLGALGNSGLMFLGIDAGDESGSAIAAAGDINGDGIGDFVVGAPKADSAANARADAGEAYLIFGRTFWTTSPIALAGLGIQGVVLHGASAGDAAGFAVGGIGDFNADGLDDLIIGAPGGDGSNNTTMDSGESYMIYGKFDWTATPTFDLTSTTYPQASVVYGLQAGDESGSDVGGAGDFNGDGISDLFIGIPKEGSSGSAFEDRGAVNIVTGAAGIGTGGGVFRLEGIPGGVNRTGSRVASVGDVNADGFDDLLIGVPGAEGIQNGSVDAGAAYLYYGEPLSSGGTQRFLSGSVGTAQAVSINGRDAGDEIGSEVAGLGDVDGDGIPDFLVGSKDADGGGNAKPNSGEGYLFVGRSFFPTKITHLGTSNSETMVGDSGMNSINGASGSDILVGGGGQDVILGGPGDDILAVSDFGFVRLDGGSGIDTLRLDGAGLELNLPRLNDERIRDIEVVDLTGSGNNSLHLTVLDVQALSKSTNTLIVRGDAGDRVGMDQDWLRQTDEMIGGNLFAVYKKLGAALKIQSGVAVDLRFINLQNLGGLGATFYGRNAYNFVGMYISPAGDFNGDGYHDFLMGSDSANSPGNLRTGAGESYLIYGKPDWSSTSHLDLENLGSDGLVIYGDWNWGAGYTQFDSGDVNGDGYDDLLIGDDYFSGNVHLVYGRPAAGTPMSIDLLNLGANGVTFNNGINSSFNPLFGHITRANGIVGDVNGDGFDDIVIGASSGSDAAGARYSCGRVYLILGRAAFPSSVEIRTSSIVSSLIIGSQSLEDVGFSIAAAGDVNADGLDDVLIGSESNLRSYLVLGRRDWSAYSTLDLAVPEPGVRLFEGSSYVVGGGGDFNGDGYADLVIGNYINSGYGISTTRYLVFGSNSLPPTTTLSSLGVHGIVLSGATTDSYGGSARFAGDINGDGYDDLLLGSSRLNASEAAHGRVFIVMGRATPPTTIDLLQNADVTLFGRDPEDSLGYSVHTAGDVNGDGFADFIVGAHLADGSTNTKLSAGETTLVFGGVHLRDPLGLVGTSVGETLSGDAAPRSIVGAEGNDTLIGNGGADVLLGGQGDDTLAVSDLSFRRVNGGTGRDTLRLDGSNLILNLSQLSVSRLSEIEVIDLTGNGNNTLIATPSSVAGLSSSTNTLLVRRDLGDIVELGSGWTSLPDQTLSGVLFSVYEAGQAKLFVQTVASSVLARRVFYNRSTSAVFGNGSGNPVDAIDPLKTALLPGQTTTVANYSNYHRGLNGLIVDIAGPPGTIGPSDFEFAVWDGIAAGGFAISTAVPTITVLPGVGESGSTRIKIEFDDNAVRNTWLRVSLLANAVTGLNNADVFYFGNAVGEMNAGNLAGPPIVLRTNATDTATVRQNQSPTQNSVGITNLYDVNKDGRVNATDTALARQNQTPTGSIAFFTAPAGLRLVSSSRSVDSAFADVGWLDAFQSDTNKRKPR